MDLCYTIRYQAFEDEDWLSPCDAIDKIKESVAILIDQLAEARKDPKNKKYFEPKFFGFKTQIEMDRYFSPYDWSNHVWSIDLKVNKQQREDGDDGNKVVCNFTQNEMLGKGALSSFEIFFIFWIFSCFC